MKRQEITTFIKGNKNFDRLWASQILSQITLNMINFVMATRIYEKTGSTVAVSFLWVFFYLPGFFLGPFSGYFIDLWSLRKTLLITNFLQGITMLLFLLMNDRIHLIYPIVFLYSLLNQFYNPAEASSLPWLVNKKNLPIANSLFLLTSQGALVLGLGVSGLMMKLFGKNNPVWVSAICLFLAALAVYFLPKKEPEKTLHQNSLSRFIKEIKFGYSFIKNSKIISFPLCVLIFFQIFITILAITLPEFSKNVLSLGMQDAGPLLIMPAGVGALLGVYLMGRFGLKYRKRTLMKFGFGLAFFVLLFFAIAMPYLGFFRYWLIIPFMFVLGIALIFIFVPNQTLVQEKTPPILRGRVYGAWGFFANILLLPCLLFASTFVELIGVRPYFFASALILLFFLIFFEKIEGFVLSEEENILNYFNSKNESK